MIVDQSVPDLHVVRVLDRFEGDRLEIAQAAFDGGLSNGQSVINGSGLRMLSLPLEGSRQDALLVQDFERGQTGSILRLAIPDDVISGRWPPVVPIGFD